MRRPYVIAVDFDGTLCSDAYPQIGAPNWEVIERAKREQKKGTILVLWTCRTGKRLEEAVEACVSWGLVFDEVNANPQCRIDQYGGSDCRKVSADEFWDDRAVCMAAPKSKRSLRGNLEEVEKNKAFRDEVFRFVAEELQPAIESAGESELLGRCAELLRAMM